MPGILKNGKNDAKKKNVQIDTKTKEDSNIPSSLTQSWINSFFPQANIAKNRQEVAKEKAQEIRHYERQLQNNNKYATLFPQGSPYLNYSNHQPNTQHHQRPVQRQYVQPVHQHQYVQPVHQRQYVQPVHQRQYVQPVVFPRGVPSSHQIFQHNGQYYINPYYKPTNKGHAYAHGGKKQKTKKSKQNKKTPKKKT